MQFASRTRAVPTLFGLAAVVLTMWLLWNCISPAPARASDLKVAGRFCHAVTSNDTGTPPSPSEFRCAGDPLPYVHDRLWLKTGLTDSDRSGPATILVAQSRFDRLDVFFDYANGNQRKQTVVSGDYKDHWRVGGLMSFDAPDIDSPLIAITLGFDGLASHKLVRVRILPVGQGKIELSLIAALTGGALMVLAGGALYNILLAAAVRRAFIGWHGAWAVCVFAWGLVWSQLALLFFPSLAGTTAAQLSTFLSMLSIAFATMSAVTAVKAHTVSDFARQALTAVAILIVLLAVPATFVRSNVIDSIAIAINLLVLITLIGVATYIGIAWRRGSAEARNFTFAWGVPMVGLALVHIFDVGNGVFSGGSQIIVLLACALQTVIMSALMTRRLLGLRLERDAARAAQAELNELAVRDPLTELLNRRGFVAHLNKQLREAELRGRPAALLVIDVDHFKSVNDRFGHDAGDIVLRNLAEELRLLEDRGCVAGRLGGEEFVLAVAGVAREALPDFAEHVRRRIEAVDHSIVLAKGERVTVSIGVAPAVRGLRFTGLFRLADDALYNAKNKGRNRVVMACSADPREVVPPQKSGVSAQ